MTQIRSIHGADNQIIPLKSVTKQSPTFSERLKSAIGKVNELQHTSDESIEKVTMGELGIHEGMLAIQEADIAMRYMLAARNKAMDAYREIMRISM